MSRRELKAEAIQRRIPKVQPPLNNLLCFTLLRSNAPPQEVDDISTIFNHDVQRHQISVELIAADENEKPKADERQRNMV